MKGILTLVPTPIDEKTPLDGYTLSMLREAINRKALFLVEDMKPGRRRWVRFGLPREEIESLLPFNEHNSDEQASVIIEHLKKGTDVFLMSDGGMPAFCDPGRNLVELAHDSKIKVRCLPFSNSVIQALALSGFNHNRFLFEGFPPVKDPGRSQFLKAVSKERRTVILMDTPYRLKRLLQEMGDLDKKRQFFLACDLNHEKEFLIRGTIAQILNSLDEYKREFILIASSY